MTGNLLRTRLDEAGLTAEEFAEIVRVDPKTVQRWLAGRVPQRRHRARIARALDTTVHELWPADPPSPTSTGNAPGPARAEGDVVASWGAADEDGAPDPTDLVASSLAAGGMVDVLDGGGQLLTDDRLLAALLEVAGARSPIRVLVDLPRRELVPLIGVAHLELRVIDHAGGCGTVRVGERMLALFSLAGAGDEPRPLLDLTATGDPGGLFARLTAHFDELWDAADDTITTDAQLDAYLIDSPGVDEYVGDGSDDEPPEPAAMPSPSAPAQPAGDKHETTPRRWPRRPT